LRLWTRSRSSDTAATARTPSRLSSYAQSTPSDRPGGGEHRRDLGR
jgi:hypothetical protein